MTTITLDTPYEVAPAVPALTTTEVTVLSVQENPGWDYDPENPASSRGPGRPRTVEVELLLNRDPDISRRIMVWEGDAYLAVRGTWTDADLAARIKEILAAQ